MKPQKAKDYNTKCVKCQWIFDTIKYENVNTKGA